MDFSDLTLAALLILSTGLWIISYRSLTRRLDALRRAYVADVDALSDNARAMDENIGALRDRVYAVECTDSAGAEAFDNIYQQFSMLLNDAKVRYNKALLEPELRHQPLLDDVVDPRLFKAPGA